MRDYVPLIAHFNYTRYVDPFLTSNQNFCYGWVIVAGKDMISILLNPMYFIQQKICIYMRELALKSNIKGLVT